MKHKVNDKDAKYIVKNIFCQQLVLKKLKVKIG